MSPAYAPPRALYIHVPFCKSRCAYCDFYSLPSGFWSPAVLEGSIEATLARIDSLMARFSQGRRELATVYIGGGTPTALSRPLLARLLKGVEARVSGFREWTLEANPESLDEEALDLAQASGVTRISLGVQSLDDGLLRKLGRLASAEACLEALARVRRRPGLRLSADLIAGLPRSRPLAMEARTLVEEGACHLSIYDLTVEEGTALAAQIKAGSLVLPEADLAYEERHEAEALLGSLGLRRYEVSNFALPGEESLHNLGYWHMDSWLGAGPGAVSSLQPANLDEAGQDRPGEALRIEEAKDAAAYGLGDPAGKRGEDFPIEARDALFEQLLMGFRTIYGPDDASLSARFGLPLEALIPQSIAAWRSHLMDAPPWPPAMGQEAGGGSGRANLALDPSGLDILNRFLVDCLGELEKGFSPARTRKSAREEREV
jgi:oxygen-independent coproporphyrinogen III oxidase